MPIRRRAEKIELGHSETSGGARSLLNYLLSQGKQRCLEIVPGESSPPSTEPLPIEVLHHSATDAQNSSVGQEKLKRQQQTKLIRELEERRQTQREMGQRKIEAQTRSWQARRKILLGLAGLVLSFAIIWFQFSARSATP